MLNRIKRVLFPVKISSEFRDVSHCKVCASTQFPSRHPNFHYCGACGCYINSLPNERYSNDFWYEHVSDEIIERDLTHWNRVTKHLQNNCPFIFSEKSELIDLAGGLGLFSASIQKISNAHCTNVDACAIPEQHTRYPGSFRIVQSDIFEYLSAQNIDGNQKTIISSHFIEHLELDQLIHFIRTLKQKFPNSNIIIYCPCADAAHRNEKNFIHFNTNLPGEHRVIWSKSALNALIQHCNVPIKYLGRFDLDLICVI